MEQFWVNVSDRLVELRTEIAAAMLAELPGSKIYRPGKPCVLYKNLLVPHNVLFMFYTSIVNDDCMQGEPLKYEFISKGSSYKTLQLHYNYVQEAWLIRSMQGL